MTPEQCDDMLQAVQEASVIQPRFSGLPSTQAAIAGVVGYRTSRIVDDAVGADTPLELLAREVVGEFTASL